MGKQRNGASKGIPELRLAVILQAMQSLHAVPKVTRTSTLPGHHCGKCLKQDHTVDTVLKQ